MSPISPEKKTFYPPQKTRHGSPLRRPGCPIGRMSIEDKSYKPRRQA